MPNASAELHVERRASLRTFNSFGLPAVAAALVRVRSESEVRRVVDHAEFGPAPKLILGGGSNLVLTRDVAAVVLKVEIAGRKLVRESATMPGSSKPVRARTGTTSSPGRCSKAGLGWRTWP